MDNIILIGFMGCGKTSIGNFISKNSEYFFIDTDYLIEKNTGLAIKTIFKIYGEKYFRLLEREVISTFFEKKINKHIISVGGGLPCFYENNKLLKKLGKIFFLKIKKKVLLNRIKNDTNRPLRFNTNLFEQRQHCYYSTADYIISCDMKSIEEIAEEILLLKNLKFKE